LEDFLPASENQPAPPLQGSVALVTGGSRGIGLAIAHRLGQLGARVTLCGRTKDRLDQARRQLTSAGIDALAVVADVTRAADIAAMVQQMETAMGPADILINNAGMGVFGAFHERSEQEWDTVLDTNLKSVFLVSRAVVPQMIRLRRGCVINISSLAGKNAFPNGGLYCASKWGLMGLSSCMAEELRVHGIRVSVICPGSVATEFSTHSGRDLKTLLQPDDVAHAVATLVTQADTSFISEIDLRPTQKP
jgi:3-oxoacyl-[acyl-carrier protein] reductase